MILIDANILMYAAGAPHRYKQPSARLLQRVALGEVEATIDAEVLQEILHRYRALGRWEDGRHVYDLARQIFPTVVPITADVLDRSRKLMDAHHTLMARDALHAAVVLTEGMSAICSYDRNFDDIAGVRRSEPSA